MTLFRMTTGADNCLLHFLHFDKYEGVIISPDPLLGLAEIVQNFHRSCSQIKHMFEKYRYRRVSLIDRCHWIVRCGIRIRYL